MTREHHYCVAKKSDGTFSLNRTTEPSPGPVAFIKPTLNRTGEITGWRLKPLVAMQGPQSRVWATAAEAIASTKLMTPAAAKRAVEHASGLAAGGVP
jgi:hypothetical protein